MLPLYVATLFVSSFLLFCVQPMIGKQVLPLLGGVPSVWNTCMFFFQVVLLAGYGYVHFLARRLPTKAQFALHAAVLILPWFALPMNLRDSAAASLSPESSPLLWLIEKLFVHGGAPFLAVSTTAPLLQIWFAGTKHPSAKQPYFLYAASNFGSLLGLLAYPVLIEPLLPLRQQTLVWTIGYALLSALVAGCGVLAWRTRASVAEAVIPAVAIPARRWIRGFCTLLFLLVY